MKTIVITGASSGIGLASARLLYESGHNIVLASRNKNKLNAIAYELGNRALACTTDVQDYSQVKQLIEKTMDHFGKVDVLVNNAGLGHFEPLVDGKIENWHDTIDTNLKGMLNCIHASLPYLIENKGHIINIGSVASHNVFPNLGIYCASKWAVFAISESLRLELSDKVKVTIISPGVVNTPFIDNTKNDKLLSELKEQFDNGLTPELVAKNIDFVINTPDSAVVSEIVIRPNW